MNGNTGTKVGVIGLGAMGNGMAQSLRRAGYSVHVFDVRADAATAFAAEGGTACTSQAELGAACEVVFSVVVNAEQTESVLFGTSNASGSTGVAASMKPGSLFAMCSTVAPALAVDFEKRVTAKGLLFLDSPISGGAARAASGEMTMMTAGPEAAYDKCEAMLNAMAAKVYKLGSAAPAGTTVKMINQLLAGVHIAAAAEAMALGIKAGADPAMLYEVISNSAGSSWMFQNRVPHILAGDYTPLSAVNIFIKDLGIVLDSAKKLPFPLPLTSSAHQMYLAAAAHGHGLEDDAAVIKMFAALTGIALPEKKA